LCFTAPVDRRGAILAAGEASGTAVTRVGSITMDAGLKLVDADGAALDLQLAGWDHFSPG
jgi:thiamine-monophosphate kinase